MDYIIELDVCALCLEPISPEERVVTIDGCREVHERCYLKEINRERNQSYS
jgi:hypothetical protein